MQDLDAIMAGRDANAFADTTTTTTEPAGSTEQGRDAQGRFAGRQEQPQAGTPPAQTETQQTTETAQTPAQEAKPTGQVPQQALHAERQARKALERQLNDMQQMLQRLQPQAPQQPAVDPLAGFVQDPTGFLQQGFQQQISPIVQQFTEFRNYMAESMASQIHGADKVLAAKQAAIELMEAGGPEVAALEARTDKAQNPFDELVKWHTERTRLAQYGNDPEAYINAEVERRMAEAMGQQQQPAAQGQIPPSFAAARNGAPRQTQQYQGPRPLSEIMKR